MKNTQMTKGSVTAAVIAMSLCFVLLLGATLAWFTDTVTNTGNKIEAGSFDVQLLMNTGDGYADISESAKPIFGADALLPAKTWLPGDMQVAYLAIKNNGTTDLEYSVSLNVENTKNDLYKVMKYAIVPDAQYGTAVTWTNGTEVFVGKQAAATNVSLPAGATHYFALAIHMDADASADYAEGVVDFDISILAVQDEYTATQAQRNDLAKQLAQAEDGATIYLEDLNYGVIGLGRGSYTYTSYAKNLTIVGTANTKIELTVSGMEIEGWTFKNVTFINNGLNFANGSTVKNLTLDGCTFDCADFDSMDADGGSITDVTFKNTTFANTQTDLAIQLRNAKNVTVEGCTFTNVGHNAVQITGATGTIFIKDNTINGTTDRAIRVSNVSATVTVENNTIVTPGDADGELMKVSGTVDASMVTLTGNTWNGKTDAEITAGMVGSNYIVK